MTTRTQRPSIDYVHAPTEIDSHRTVVGKALLACGAASTLFYFGMDVAAALLYDGYSYTDQTISELSAISAPTRSLWVPLGFVYGVLVIAFGYGIWVSAGHKRALSVVAGLVLAMGLVSLVAWPLAPMHQRDVLAGGGATFSDTLHLILAGVNSLLFILMIAVGATGLGKHFRLYSIVTIVAVLIFGALTFLAASGVEANEPTPWLGVKERIAVFASMLWMAVLATLLWRAQHIQLRRKESGRTRDRRCLL
jgi:hypothetical protein